MKKYKVGDRVIIHPSSKWSPGGYHHTQVKEGAIGIITNNVGIAYDVQLGDNFGAYLLEYEIELDKEYYRDNKLKEIFNESQDS